MRYESGNFTKMLLNICVRLTVSAEHVSKHMTISLTVQMCAACACCTILVASVSYFLIQCLMIQCLRHHHASLRDLWVLYWRRRMLRWQPHASVFSAFIAHVPLSSDVSMVGNRSYSNPYGIGDPMYGA